MRVQGIEQPPFNTTLMGVLRGVIEHFELSATNAALYGGSGHAFLMNVHEELCPSGPYCWTYDGFLALVRNLGIEMTRLGSFSRESGPTERAAIEASLRELLDRGVPCSLLNMENQLVTGYDDAGLLTAQPWAPHVDFPPARLSFGTWAELGDEVHVTFYSFRPVPPSRAEKTIADSLRFAADLHRCPSRHTDRPYAVGAGAYAAWIGAVQKGHGGSHGNWWNGMVWTECRARAAEYFTEIAASHPLAAPEALALAGDYRMIADCLQKASDKSLDAREKITLLQRAGALEAGSIERIEALAARFD
jgi:hypothetical protein